MFGRPTLALRQGGYLDTVTDGVSGLFFDRAEPDAIAATLALSDRHDWDPDTLRSRAEEFGEPRFIDRIRDIALGDEHRTAAERGMDDHAP